MTPAEAPDQQVERDAKDGRRLAVEVEALLDSLETIMFGDIQRRSRDDLEARAQELVDQRAEQAAREKRLREAEELARRIVAHGNPDWGHGMGLAEAVLAIRTPDPSQDVDADG